MESRLARLESVCAALGRDRGGGGAGRGGGGRRPLVSPREARGDFLVSRKDRVAYCPQAKVGEKKHQSL